MFLLNRFNKLERENITLINLDVHQYISKKTLSVPLDALKKRKQTGAYDELQIAKLMKYYGFQTRDELLDFLKTSAYSSRHTI